MRFAESNRLGQINKQEAKLCGSPEEALASVEPPECQQCAACCFSEQPRFVPVTGNDYARLGDEAEEFVHFIENRAFMLLSEGHCAALKFDEATRTFACQVYVDRPEICRNLARGSPACFGERYVKAERVLARLRVRGR